MLYPQRRTYERKGFIFIALLPEQVSFACKKWTNQGNIVDSAGSCFTCACISEQMYFCDAAVRFVEAVVACASPDVECLLKTRTRRRRRAPLNRSNRELL